MALFNLFGSKGITLDEEQEILPTVLEDTTPDDSQQKEVTGEEKKNLITIIWGTGKPIDVIYNFIHKDMEEVGFQDALVNNDIEYRDAKEAIIRNDLEMLFRRIRLRYNDEVATLEIKIGHANKACAYNAADQLSTQREVLKRHLAELDTMEQMLVNNDPKMLTMIHTYRRGFLKGVGASVFN